MSCEIGEIGCNHFGTKMQIIRVSNTDDIDVKFLDENQYVKEHVIYQNFKRGNIKNPFDRNIYGVGYLGVGVYKTGRASNKPPDYSMWNSMIYRCYGKDGTYPGYNGITTVCEEWQNFQNFAEWFHSHEYIVNERLHLDKDILCPGNKVYEPSRCLLVPQRINMLFMNKTKNDGLPNGIKATKSGRYSAQYNCKHLGTFQTLDEAYSIYASAKEKHIQDVANEYKDIIPNDVYSALINYRVRIEYDKNYS